MLLLCFDFDNETQTWNTDKTDVQRLVEVKQLVVYQINDDD